ncbi:hypothetical protein [Alkanindiges illinoisensis]|uniref:hypothetical protein n=1 Tax=Alkanindiges illinoisensis TaxID=197183 RepID=UPI001D17BEA5|nr:hypothetical protein [Alkanindiges illinoisensis]
MNTTKILGEAVGVQYQEIQDHSETDVGSILTSALIIGRFKRGEVGRAMNIHQGNIRGMLGYDPKNLDYIAVQDCLDAGVSSVMVLRVSNLESIEPEEFSFLRAEQSDELILFDGDLSPILIESGVT